MKDHSWNLSRSPLEHVTYAPELYLELYHMRNCEIQMDGHNLLICVDSCFRLIQQNGSCEIQMDGHKLLICVNSCFRLIQQNGNHISALSDDSSIECVPCSTSSSGKHTTYPS